MNNVKNSGSACLSASISSARLRAPVIVMLGLLTSLPAVAQEAETIQASKAASAEDSGADNENFLTDEQGRRYQVVDYPKGTEGVHYLRLEGNLVQIRNGLQLEVLSETQTHFKLKVPAGTVEHPTASQTKIAVPNSSIKTASSKEIDSEELDSEETIERPSADALEFPTVVLDSVDRVTLVPFDRGLPSQGQWRNGFDLADMDDDGHVDIVFGAGRKEHARPNLFLGRGDGTWRRWPGRFPDVLYDYGDATAADFNRDGHMDFALAVHLSGLVVLVSDGRGGYDTWSEGIEFKPAGEIAKPDAFSSRAVEAIDWDGDGWVDLVALGEGPKGIVRNPSKDGMLSSPGLRVFLNQGTGQWTTLRDDSASSAFGDSLAIADLNQDGRLDVFTASRSAQERRQLHFQQEGGGWTTRPAVFVRPGAFVFAVQAADLDDDGHQDLLVGYTVSGQDVQWTGVDVAYGVGDGRFQRRALYSEESRAGVYSLSVGNVDRDGWLDVAIGTGDGRILLLLGVEGRRFVAERSPAVEQKVSGCVVYGLRLGNVDGKPGDELVAAFAGERTGLGKFHTSAGCTDGGRLAVWKAQLRNVD